MFGRIFGRGKDEPEAEVCAMCGRTLLAGEWTRKITGAKSEERLVCSLCGPDLPLDDRDLHQVSAEPASPAAGRDEPLIQEIAPDPAYEPTPAVGAAQRAPVPQVHECSPVDQFERRLVEVEARCDVLGNELAQLREALNPGTAAASEAPDVADAAPIDSSEPGERTWGETPAEFAALLRSSEHAAAEPPLASPEPTGEPETPAEVAVEVGDSTELMGEELLVAAQALEPPEPEGLGEPPSLPESDDMLTEAVATALVAAESGGAAAVGEDSGTEEGEPPEEPDEVTAAGAALGEEEHVEVEPAAGDTEADVAALALLQRGVDLFNVSRVPRRIAETNEQLGAPDVMAEALYDQMVSISFTWSMGWYRFNVDTESGAVDMADRGYEENKGVLSNAGVRADGTIHLAPAKISTAAASRFQQEEAQDQRRDNSLRAPESPSVAAQKPPEILSKSLLGQRSDDKPADWEKTQARDFDWER